MATNTTGMHTHIYLKLNIELNKQNMKSNENSNNTFTQTDATSMKNVVTSARKKAESEEEKQLRIKVSVCKRCSKDLIYYGKEVEKQKAKIEKMKKDGRDEHDVKKQIQVLEESQEMIPLSRDQLRKAKADLKKFMESNTGSIESSKHYDDAKDIIKEE